MDEAQFDRDSKVHGYVPWVPSCTQHVGNRTPPQLPALTAYGLPQLHVNTTSRGHPCVPRTDLGLLTPSPSVTRLSPNSFEDERTYSLSALPRSNISLEYSYAPTSVYNQYDYQLQHTFHEDDLDDEQTRQHHAQFCHNSASIPDPRLNPSPQWQSNQTDQQDFPDRKGSPTSIRSDGPKTTEQQAQTADWHGSPPSPYEQQSHGLMMQPFPRRKLSYATFLSRQKILPHIPHGLPLPGANPVSSDSFVPHQWDSSAFVAQEQYCNYGQPVDPSRIQDEREARPYTTAPATDGARLQQIQSHDWNRPFAPVSRQSLAGLHLAPVQQDSMRPYMPEYDDSGTSTRSKWQPMYEPPASGRSKTGKRPDRDALLLHCRSMKMSYKDIKKVHGFDEAESTLRGRYRALVKRKEDRVRRPEWTELDVRLLCEAVTLFSEGKVVYLQNSEDIDRLQIPWKEVSKYIRGHGGSYQFGYSTVKKKWTKLFDEGRHML